MNSNSFKTKQWVKSQRDKGLCVMCTLPAVAGRRKCEKHLTFSSKRTASLKRELVKNGWCRQCGEGTLAVLNRTYCQSCLNKKKQAGQKHKESVINHYGAQCCWPGCANTDIDMLTIDHVFDDGFKERTPAGDRLSGNAFYLRVIRSGYPEGKYQVLCWNHQWKKRMITLRDEVQPELKETQCLSHY